MPRERTTLRSSPQRGPATAMPTQRAADAQPRHAPARRRAACSAGSSRDDDVHGAEPLRAAPCAADTRGARARRRQHRQDDRQREQPRIVEATRRRDHGSGPRHAASSSSSDERERREYERPAKQLRVAHVRARPHRLALELIDLLVDALQRRGVARAEVAAARSSSRCR